MPLSLIGEFWGGYCPECNTPDSEMCLNRDANWECPKCHLVIQSNEIVETVDILAGTGKGKFVQRHHSHVSVSQSSVVCEGRIRHDYRNL